ncbi:HAD family hydrolase [Paratractidigestivibacter sp.]|uniref:HAD family hydrolase n=1 Tax=Paratractidigestivibacter sp. TaxID=2847316 RepID=UPI002ABD7E43|nr:HAD hydrolase family protein [Paratractidigestivibacter sp.]
MGRIRLIASDIDATPLFDRRARTLNPDALVAVEHALDAGIMFVAASGRQCFNMRNLFGSLADRLIYVCDNGALALQGSKVLHNARSTESNFSNWLTRCLNLSTCTSC